MLGKTNITTLDEGTIITEIEDYNWIQVQAGTRSDFVMAGCQNGYLAAAAADGSVAYTKDGEIWEVSKPEFVNCKINDIDWDGHRFLLAGTCTDGGRDVGLILETDDFKSYKRIDIENSSDSEDDCDTEYCAVYPCNGKYIVIAKRVVKNSADSNKYVYVYAYIGDFVNEWGTKNKLHAYYETNGDYYNARHVAVAKSSSGMLLRVHYNAKVNTSVTWYDEVRRIDSSGEFAYLYALKSGTAPCINVFECKDALFYGSTVSTDNYKIVKVLPSNESNILSTGQNFAFKDAVYFSESQILINDHEMLVVKKGQNISEKKPEDLVEIAPEAAVNCIVRAFGRLYVFGVQGTIIKSSEEASDPNGAAVRAMSARKALAEAKAYTDTKCMELEARIRELESRIKQ